MLEQGRILQVVNLNIRKFRKQDLTDVQTIMQLSWDWYRPRNLVDLYQFIYSNIPNRMKWSLIERASDSLFTSRRNTCVFVAEVSGKAAGFAALFYIGRDFWELRWLAVHPKYQRQGIGSKLISHTISYVQQMKGKGITLSSNIKNKKALELYKRFGFIETYQTQHMDLVF